MKNAKLLFNPTAGDEGNDKDDLIAQIKAAGYRCEYASVKGWNWDNFDDDLDFLIVAGGDGTVRKVTKELLERTMLDKTYPIALLPLGTANNISKTLHIQGDTNSIIQSWRRGKLKKYDVGKIGNVKKAAFFLESFGYGLFPYLMMEMKKVDKKRLDTPENKIQTALQLLLAITQSYESRYCRLKVDGKDYSGKYLLAEVMNICSIGPNLFLSQNADPGDGIMEVVLLPEEDKQKFADYLSCKIDGHEEHYAFTTVKAQHVSISWDGTHVHADDEVVKIEKNDSVSIDVKPGLLQFLVP